MARTFERTLPVKLSTQELLDRGLSLALERKARVLRQEEGKREAAQAKAEIESHDAEIDRLAAILRDRAEPRPVQCRLQRDLARFVVETVRLDTGELVESRPMAEEERQTDLWPDEDSQVLDLAVDQADQPAPTRSRRRKGAEAH